MQSEFEKQYPTPSPEDWKDWVCAAHAEYKRVWIAALKKIDSLLADDEIIRNKNDLRQFIADELDTIEKESK